MSSSYICRPLPIPDFIARFDTPMLVGHLMDASFIPGEKGNPGKTAYQVAVDNGYEGTEEDWLNSLIGKDGEKGEPGEPGELPSVDLENQPTEEQPAYLGFLTATGWFRVLYTKLVEWLGTHFSPYRIAPPVASYADVALNDTLQDLADKMLGVQKGHISEVVINSGSFYTAILDKAYRRVSIIAYIPGDATGTTGTIVISINDIFLEIYYVTSLRYTGFRHFIGRHGTMLRVDLAQVGDAITANLTSEYATGADYTNTGQLLRVGMTSPNAAFSGGIQKITMTMNTYDFQNNTIIALFL